MIKEFVFAWEANKGKLKKYFEEHSKEEYCSYKTVVRLLFELVVNPYLTEHKKGWREPDCEDYVMTCAWYGSCETCDLMQSIYWPGGMADEEDVRCLMLLSLHLLQRCKMPYADDVEEMVYEEPDERPRLTEEALEKAAEGGPSGTVVVEVPRLTRSTLLIKRPTREGVSEKRLKRGGWGEREKKQVRMAVMLAPARPDYLREWGERWRRFFWKWKDWC